MKKISLSDALRFKIQNEWQYPVIGDFDIAVMLIELYRDKKAGPHELRVTRDSPEAFRFRPEIHRLLNSDILTESPWVASLYQPSWADASLKESVCFANPLCYVSHLSAMEVHGITNRMPSTTYFTSPDHATWKSTIARHRAIYLQDKRIPSDNELIAFVRYRDESPTESRKLRGKQRINLVKTNKWSERNAIQTQGYRVSTIGRTFLDMVSKPEYCGGMSHVISVFEEWGKLYKNQILMEASNYGNKIEKSRIGYLMEEIVGITNNSTLDDWAETAVQRGGSRRLNPHNSFEPTISERWCLSINV